MILVWRAVALGEGTAVLMHWSQQVSLAQCLSWAAFCSRMLAWDRSVHLSLAQNVKSSTRVAHLEGTHSLLHWCKAIFSPHRDSCDCCQRVNIDMTTSGGTNMVYAGGHGLSSRLLDHVLNVHTQQRETDGGMCGTRTFPKFLFQRPWNCWNCDAGALAESHFWAQGQKWLKAKQKSRIRPPQKKKGDNCRKFATTQAQSMALRQGAGVATPASRYDVSMGRRICQRSSANDFFRHHFGTLYRRSSPENSILGMDRCCGRCYTSMKRHDRPLPPNRLGMLSINLTAKQSQVLWLRAVLGGGARGGVRLQTLRFSALSKRPIRVGKHKTIAQLQSFGDVQQCSVQGIQMGGWRLLCNSLASHVWCFCVCPQCEEKSYMPNWASLTTVHPYCPHHNDYTFNSWQINKVYF